MRMNLCMNIVCVFVCMDCIDCACCLLQMLIVVYCLMCFAFCMCPALLFDVGIIIVIGVICGIITIIDNNAFCNFYMRV